MLFMYVIIYRQTAKWIERVYNFLTGKGKVTKILKIINWKTKEKRSQEHYTLKWKI